MLGEIVGRSANYRLIIDHRSVQYSAVRKIILWRAFILSPKTFRVSTSFFCSARNKRTSRNTKRRERGMRNERERGSTLFCFPLFRHGACPSARKSAVESSFVEVTIFIATPLLCNFLKEKKRKKEGKRGGSIVGGDIFFFFF